MSLPVFKKPLIKASWVKALVINTGSPTKLSLSKNAFEMLRSGLLAINVTNVPESTYLDLLSFLDILAEWNEKMNLTAVTGIDGVITHLVDSLSMARLPFFTGEQRIVDIGSGAGLPGIPLALAYPKATITLVESISKKVTFQQHVVDELGLVNVDPRQGRAEVLAREKDLNKTFDIATARAVGSLADICKWCSPFLREGGYLIAYKGKPEAIDEIPPGWELALRDNFLLVEKQRTLVALQYKRKT